MGRVDNFVCGGRNRSQCFVYGTCIGAVRASVLAVHTPYSGTMVISLWWVSTSSCSHLVVLTTAGHQGTRVNGIARIYGVLVVPNYPVTIIVLWIVQYGVSTLYTCTHTLLFIVHPG